MTAPRGDCIKIVIAESTL